MKYLAVATAALMIGGSAFAQSTTTQTQSGSTMQGQSGSTMDQGSMEDQTATDDMQTGTGQTGSSQMGTGQTGSSTMGQTGTTGTGTGSSTGQSGSSTMGQSGTTGTGTGSSMSQSGTSSTGMQATGSASGMSSGGMASSGGGSPERDARGIPVVSNQATAPSGANAPVPSGGTVVPSPNQAQVFAPQPASGEYPTCSRTVTDGCVQSYERGRTPR